MPISARHIRNPVRFVLRLAIMTASATLTLTLTQALAKELARHTTQAFGLMGNGNAHFIDALDEFDIAFTPVRHEVATVASADAYARVSGHPAIATTTYGAGFTNTMTALAEAAQAGTPMFVVVGDMPTSGARPWDVNQQMLGSAVGVKTFELSLDNVGEVVSLAVETVLRDRRPVVIGIPYDLVAKPITAAIEHHSSSPQVDAQPDPAAFGEAVQALQGAKRPLILAGRGAWLSGAGAVLGQLATQLGALTATTALARGLFTEAQFDLGLTGGFGQSEAMAKIEEADVVLVVGAGLNQFTMRFGELFSAGTIVIRVDLDDLAVPKTAHPISHILLQGDAKETAEKLSAALDGVDSSGWRDTVNGLEPGGALRVRVPGDGDVEGLLSDGLLDPRNLAARLAVLLPADRHVTFDGGHFMGWANMYWSVASPERMIMVGAAFQTIGLGFSTVAGVAAAAPDSTIVLNTGDGGGLMAIADLETTIRTARSCVVVVWNDSQYSAEVHLYGRMGLDQEPMRIPQVDFAGVASALGATGVVVNQLSDLSALEEWVAAGSQGTILLDCRISGTVVAPHQYEILRVNGVD